MNSSSREGRSPVGQGGAAAGQAGQGQGNDGMHQYGGSLRGKRSAAPVAVARCGPVTSSYMVGAATIVILEPDGSDLGKTVGRRKKKGKKCVAQ